LKGAVRRWLGWFRDPGNRSRRATERSAKVPKEIAAEFTTEELMEFLEGDLYPTQADPAFKEKLRGELWEMVQRRYRAGTSDERSEE